MTLRRQLLSTILIGYALAVCLNLVLLGWLLVKSQRFIEQETAAEFLELGVNAVDPAATHFFARLSENETLRDELKAAEYGEVVSLSELIVVADRNGNVLHSSVEDPVLTALLTQERLSKPWERYPITQKETFVLDNYDQVRAADEPSLPVRLVFRIYPDEDRAIGYGRLYHGILARQQYLEMVGHRRSRLSFILGSSILLLLGAALARLSDVLLSRSITTPVSRLVEQVSDIGNGSFRKPVTVSEPAELKSVAESINAMARSLADSYEEAEEKNRQIRESLAEKESLLREIHHRVKNNMQMTASLLRLQMDSVENERLRQYLTDALNRITAMALVHELLYQSERISRVDPREYLKDLLNQVTLGYDEKMVKHELTVSSPELEPSTILPLGLVVNELLSNTIKYATDDEGACKITISLVRGDGGFQLSYTDSGPGLPQGLDPARAETLGLRLLVTLSEQLGGEPRFSNREGFSFTLSWSDSAFAESA